MSKNFGFDTALICKAGHVANLYKDLHSECNIKHCLLCPEEVISECPHCHERIRGGYYSEAVWSETAYVGDPVFPDEQNHLTIHYQELTTPDNYELPAYCHKCGQPYPWTEKLLNDAEIIIDSFDELSVEDRKLLKDRFPDLVFNTPNSTSAALFYSKLIACLKSVGSVVGKDLLIRLLSEHVPESLFTLMNLH